MRKAIFLALATCITSIGLTLSGHAREENGRWEEVKTECLKNIRQFEGWCPLDKAEAMMELIRQTSPSVCVEIGVFGGSSIFPTVMALRYNQKGIVHAIDPWSKEACLKGYETDDPNYDWWSKVNLETILESFKMLLGRWRLQNYCNIMRMTSAEAACYFEEESIDILHIDGNHTEDSALFDAKTFLPKVKKGGYIWFDDANWTSTHKAIAFLMEHCELDPSIPLTNPYLLFQKK